MDIFISLILETSSVSTLSNMVPTPAWWALLRCTCRPVANNIPSFTDIERCEKAAISNSFQPVIDILNSCLNYFDFNKLLSDVKGDLLPLVLILIKSILEICLILLLNSISGGK